MFLTDTIIRNTKPGAKPIRLTDGDGLSLFVQPTGSRWWRMRFQFEGRERMLSVGRYPEISLKEARNRRFELRRQVALGIDPSRERRLRRQTRQVTFELVTREWWEKRKHLWKGKYGDTILTRFQQDVFPYIGHRPIDKVDAADFLEVLQRMERRGVLETAHKMRTKCGEVMRYAVATRRATTDPTIYLKGALTPVRVKHYASITMPSKVGELMRAIHTYRGKTHIVRCALRLLPLVFVRSSELRYARWEEIDFDKALWRIPAERMKRPVPHIVPLSRQAVAILEELLPLSGPDGLLFPSIRTFVKPISNNTINSALRLMGYGKEDMTGHGFRSMASTLLNELGWKPDAIERQLAHTEGNDVRAAYNYAEYLAERRQMMQAWADYLDQLRGQGERRAVAVKADAAAWLIRGTKAQAPKQQEEQE